MKRPTVLLADDHTIVVEGLRCILEPEFELVGAVGDGRALVAATEKLHPDVVITDISMPLLNGLEATRQIMKADRRTKIIFLTMHADVNYSAEAFQAGASGYLLKQSAAEELLTAIREVLKGRVYLSPLVAKGVLYSFMEGRDQHDKPSVKLSSRQREVLQLLAEGQSVKQIAATLNISTRTAEFHKYAIMEKLGLHTIAALVRYAIKHGVVSL